LALSDAYISHSRSKPINEAIDLSGSENKRALSEKRAAENYITYTGLYHKIQARSKN